MPWHEADFLFLSIFNFTFAGLAQTTTMHEIVVDLVTGAEDVTEASERAHTPSEESPGWLGRPSTAGHMHSRFDLIPAQSFNDGSQSTDSDDPEKRTK
jgi:hypothetical protein